MHTTGARAKLIVTHKDPDLDAIGFIYSARKVFGSELSVECRNPTQKELEDPTVIVGDIGLPGCKDIGYSPTLNNFDHHYSRADRSATFLFNEKYHALRQDMVEYIDMVDTQGGKDDSEETLKVAAVGIRVRHDGADLEILGRGGRFLEWAEKTGTKPGDISGALPEEVQTYLRTGQEEVRRIRRELPTMERYTTNKGRTVGYLVTTSLVLSVVKEEMFPLGLDIAVVYSSTKNRFSIASNVRASRPISLNQEGLADALTAAERSYRMSSDPKWGGHEDRIGSPQDYGSSLSHTEILAIVQEKL